MKIKEIVGRRTDLSTFLVPLTKGDNPSANLTSIIDSRKIEARNNVGHAKDKTFNPPEINSQKVVCFTETPNEFINLLVQEIEEREFSLKPYGIAVPKLLARKRGLNPVWYIDIPPGHEWLTNS